MNKATIFLLLFFVLAGCRNEPFVEHEIKMEKLSADCNKLNPYFRMVSNFGGERFEFERCLAIDYNKQDAKVSRQGDTVVVQLSTPASQKGLFKITLDIDSYPRYNFITIDGETFRVVPSY